MVTNQEEYEKGKWENRIRGKFYTLGMVLFSEKIKMKQRNKKLLSVQDCNSIQV